MGGRGASSGVSNRNRKNEKMYGTEYESVYESGNIKYVVSLHGSNTAPLETMTNGRIYVTVDKNTNELKYISYYDQNNKRFKQIDLQHFHKVDGELLKPHVHKGYEHNEHGDYKLSPKEQKMVDRVTKVWYNRIDK